MVAACRATSASGAASPCGVSIRQVPASGRHVGVEAAHGLQRVRGERETRHDQDTRIDALADPTDDRHPGHRVHAARREQSIPTSTTG